MRCVLSTISYACVQSEEDGTPAYWVAATQQQGRFVELAPGQETADDNDRPVFFFVVCMPTTSLLHSPACIARGVHTHRGNVGSLKRGHVCTERFDSPC
jgi:hypothetical protein